MPKLTMVLTVLVLNSLGLLGPGSAVSDIVLPQRNRTKITVSGTVTSQQPDRFTVIDSRNHETVVLKTSATRFIEKKTRGGKETGRSNVLGGLYVEVVGVLGANNEVTADVIIWTDLDYRVAQAIESRLAPLEGRTSDVESKVSAVEGNNQRLSGQLEELAGASNGARGGAKAAQATADAAIAGVNATNERVSAIDDYKIAKVVTIRFTARSAVITETAKAQLQQLGAEFSQWKGYVVEVAGFGDKTGTNQENVRLSQERADVIAHYLAGNRLVPVRRLLLPVGYGTRDSGEVSGGRVEIRILLNVGLTAPAPTPGPQP